MSVQINNKVKHYISPHLDYEVQNHKKNESEAHIGM